MFKFKKVASIIASILMVGSTIGLAAAATYPAPFVEGGSADVALVWGTAAANTDVAAVVDITNDLNGYVTADAVTNDGTVTGGDFVQISKSSDELNLGNTWGVFTGSIDDSDLSTLLADGTYRAYDNDEFDYEQKIILGAPNFTHFRDSDYEDQAGLDDRTPTVGFKIGSNTFIMNYTLDFTTDAESDLASNDLDDIEKSVIPLLGKDYYVSNMDEQSGNIFIGKTTLLDSAVSGVVSEGETVTKMLGDTSYDVSLAFISATSVKFTVNGQTTNQLAKGESYKLSDGTYIGAKDITKLEVAG